MSQFSICPQQSVCRAGFQKEDTPTSNPTKTSDPEKAFSPPYPELLAELSRLRSENTTLKVQVIGDNVALQTSLDLLLDISRSNKELGGQFTSLEGRLNNQTNALMVLSQTSSEINGQLVDLEGELQTKNIHLNSDQETSISTRNGLSPQA